MTTGTDIRTRADTAVTVQTECRLCRSPWIVPLWSFGTTPLANAYVRDDALDSPEVTAPLDVYRCEDCHLVQLHHSVSPDLLFRNYLYVSSTSPRFVAHFETYARHLVERLRLRADSLVVDVGSNDGILLRPLKRLGIRVLGIEPAEAIAATATAAGVETIPQFFRPELAAALRHQHGPAAVITANNVFAHTPDIEGFVRSVKELLAADGVFVFEVQYLGELLRNNLFDIVYHEHLCYYHLCPLVTFFARQGMEVFDVQLLPVHGGSLRVFVQRSGSLFPRERAVEELLEAERRAGLLTPIPYREFAERIERNKLQLRKLLEQLKQQGKRIAGYGAPAKATTLLSTFGIGAETLDYIVDDDTTFKQGRFMPGSHIPIVSPEYLYHPLDAARGKPDYCLILSWNFAEPIMHNHARFTEDGGYFIVPVPEPRIVSRRS